MEFRRPVALHMGLLWSYLSFGVALFIQCGLRRQPLPRLQQLKPRLLRLQSPNLQRRQRP